MIKQRKTELNFSLNFTWVNLNKFNLYIFIKDLIVYSGPLNVMYLERNNDLAMRVRESDSKQTPGFE